MVCLSGSLSNATQPSSSDRHPCKRSRRPFPAGRRLHRKRLETSPQSRCRSGGLPGARLKLPLPDPLRYWRGETKSSARPNGQTSVRGRRSRERWLGRWVRFRRVQLAALAHAACRSCHPSQEDGPRHPGLRGHLLPCRPFERRPPGRARRGPSKPQPKKRSSASFASRSIAALWRWLPCMQLCPWPLSATAGSALPISQARIAHAPLPDPKMPRQNGGRANRPRLRSRTENRWLERQSGTAGAPASVWDRSGNRQGRARGSRETWPRMRFARSSGHAMEARWLRHKALRRGQIAQPPLPLPAPAPGSDKLSGAPVFRHTSKIMTPAQRWRRLS